jgi:hypothetical protein
MLELEPDTKNLKKIRDHQYYLFPSPATHTNQENRPTEYADEKTLKTYLGRGSNRAALLHPDVLTPANALMAALLDYGDTIGDWSLQSAVIQNGYRPDDESQGRTYLRIINQTIANNPKIFGDLKVPESLNTEAQVHGSTNRPCSLIVIRMIPARKSGIWNTGSRSKVSAYPVVSANLLSGVEV